MFCFGNVVCSLCWTSMAFKIYTSSVEKWKMLVIILLSISPGSVPEHMGNTCRRGLLYKVAGLRSPTSESRIRIEELLYVKVLEQCASRRVRPYN